MTTTTKERPILFSGPMVRALLAGTKTQTRRVMSERHRWHFIEGWHFIEACGDLALCLYGPQKRWTPAIHMPRAASRITLEITEVRVERLQEISEADAVAEGCARLPLQDGPGAWWSADVDAGPALHGRTARDAYRLLWESINGPGSWGENPWVWVIAFKVCS